MNVFQLIRRIAKSANTVLHDRLVKIEMVVLDEMKDKAIAAIGSAARTGRIGDGKIFVSRVEDAIRIRNDERGETAL